MGQDRTSLALVPHSYCRWLDGRMRLCLLQQVLVRMALERQHEVVELRRRHEAVRRLEVRLRLSLEPVEVVRRPQLEVEALVSRSSDDTQSLVQALAPSR